MYDKKDEMCARFPQELCILIMMMTTLKIFLYSTTDLITKRVIG